MSTEQQWPDVLWLVRHGESAGNVARDLAVAARLPSIDITVRDVDVPLSPLGERQSAALGRWFGQLPVHERPTVVLTSPYLRARQTADLLFAAAATKPVEHDAVVDERLREKEFGMLDRLTSVGIKERYPEQVTLRSWLGKFYYRPPSGESWCDVILRLRGMVDTITRDYRQERVLIVCHTVVVLCFRYLLERMSEEQLLAVDREQAVPNCSVTSYQFDPHEGKNGRLVPRLHNFVAPLEAAHELVTDEPDAKTHPR
jgi:broad specificity phosphatase PhoE